MLMEIALGKNFDQRGADSSTMHDPGGKTRIRLPGDVRGAAAFSDCGRYSYSLERDWTVVGAPPRTVVFIGMNPSVADASVQDPTCAKETGLARRWGFTRYVKGNMLDWRATSPKDLPHEPDIACSIFNLPAILDMVQSAEFVVLAYGVIHKRHAATVDRTIGALRATGKPLFCLGRNADGSAKHPLYLRNDVDLMAF